MAASLTADLSAFVPRGSVQWLRDEPEVRHRRRPGSLVFVDISGFTAMSERLARLGPVGAEEVTELLNHTFSRLLGVAYEDDGSLLKFGGDALLVQFEGAEHCARAVHAAWGMRAKLRELQPLQSSAGLVRLRMSCGVHTGEIDQFLVGTDHREHLIVGPAATAVVRLEGAAAAGQIMLSPAVVAALDARVAVSEATPGWLLRSAPPTPMQAGQPQVKVNGGLAHQLLPALVRDRLASDAIESEHRPSVIGFVKVAGIDGHLEQRGPESTALALGHLVDSVVHACRPGDVCLLATDVDADGAKLILTAGVPTSREFDGERMLRAVRTIVDDESRLPVKVGVHCGPVFAGVIGPWFRLTYTVIGDAVNLAARVMGHAQPGEVLATAEVLNRTQSLFASDELPPFPVKGKKRPVTAYRVGAATGHRLRRPRSRFRLAGRRAELAHLIETADSAAAGPGVLVQLAGAAGIGKSRLVDELQERRPGLWTVMASCRHESTTPYHAAADLLRQLLDLSELADASQLAGAVDRAAPHLGDALPLIGDVMGIDTPENDATRDLTPAFRAERAADAASSLLELLVPEPGMIVVEDLHWVDPESLTVLTHLARSALPRRRWLLLGTAREPRPRVADLPVHEQVIELTPLDEGAAREMVLAAAEEGLLSLERAQQLVERSGGNPFFLQELLVAGDSAELPDNVDALMQAQLDQLPPGDRALLCYASVLGTEVDLQLLEATTGISVAEQRTALRRLRTFLDPSGTGQLRFRHALVRDGAYRRLPFRRRRQLHRSAAAALEVHQPPRPDLLAFHTHHAHDWERSHHYSLEAARQASTRFANLTAAEHYRRAIESSRHLGDLSDDEVADSWERLGDALMLASSYDDAVTAYGHARRLAEGSRLVRLCGQVGQLRERQGRFPDALRWYTRAIKLDEPAQTGQTARLLTEAAIVRNRQGRPRDALALAARAEPLSGDVQAQARIHYVRAWAAMLLGEDAADDRRRTLELFEDADDLIGQGLAHNIISMAAYYRGDWDEAAESYERAAAVRHRVGDEVGMAVMAGNLGELRSDQGHFDDARPLLDECRSVCAAAGFASSRCFATMILGRLDARVGRYEDAELQLKEALVALEGLGMSGLVFDCRRYLAELSIFRGDFSAASTQADQLDAAASLGTASLRSVGHRLRTCAQLGQGSAEAASTARELLARLDPDAHDYDTGLSLVVAAAALDDADDAARAANGAAAILARLGVVVPGELLVFGPTRGRVITSP